MKQVSVTHRPVQRANVLLVLQDAKTGKTIRTVHAKNIVTNDGAEYYAEQGAGETPTYAFNNGKIALASSYFAAEAVTNTLGLLTFSDITGIQSFASGYPKTSDSDTDNTQAGARVVSYYHLYTTSQANFTIKALAIVRSNYTLSTDVASNSLRKILNYLTLSVAQQITKTSAQVLKVFVNHAFSGTA